MGSASRPRARFPRLVARRGLFFACVLLLAPPSFAQECAARETDCCSASMGERGFAAPSLGPLKPPSPSAATHCPQTGVFSHSVPIDPASTADVFFTTNADLLQNLWRKRPLNEERGTPSGCGASLDPDTYKITLEPGTYLIEGSCLHAGTSKSACRLIKLKSDGSYDSTLALGTIGMSRANGNTGNTYFSNGLSTFPPTEVVVTEQTQILVHQFFWNGAAVNGGPANQGGDRPNYGYTTALGTRVSVRRLPDARARSTCVVREEVTGESGPHTGLAVGSSGTMIRKLNGVYGDTSRCGATVSSANNVRLEPGSTYLVSARVPSFMANMHIGFVREVAGESDTTPLEGGFSAWGHPGGCERARGDITTSSDIPPFEITVPKSAPRFLRFYSWMINADGTWGAGIGPTIAESGSYNTNNNGESKGALTQISIRRLARNEFGRSCVAMERGSDLFALGGFVDAEWTPRRLNRLEGDPSRCGVSLDEVTHEVTLQPGYYAVDGFGVGRGVGMFEVALVALDAPGGARAETAARSHPAFSDTTYQYANTQALIPTTEVVVEVETTFRLEQWSRYANPGVNAEGFGKLYGVSSAYPGNITDVVNAQLRIERLVE